MSATEPDLVVLGVVARPHGVKGELRVHRFNPESEFLLGLERVWLRREGEPPQLRKILASRPHKELVLLTLVGVASREEAEGLRGVEVCVPRSALPEPDEDEFYHVDLIGLRALDVDGVEIGVVSNVIRYPTVDCAELQTSSGQVLEVPLLEPYVMELDPASGRVVLAHLDDLEPKKTR